MLIFLSFKKNFIGVYLIYNVVLASGIQHSELVASQVPLCRRLERREFDPWVGKISWRKTWQPTPVLLPGESHGQRSLEGYSPWGCKELNMTEAT